MTTILDLAREIRHHIISHSTGRLEIMYSQYLRSVDFSNGTIVSARDVVLPCFEEAPSDFSFRRMEIPVPNTLQSAALLVEAMESLDDRTLQRVWEPYRNWTVLFPEDPEIHDTKVSSLLEKGEGRPRSMLHLAVSGALTLGPPVAKSMDEEIKEIRDATARDDYWQVLNIARSASSKKIKKAFRKRSGNFIRTVGTHQTIALLRIASKALFGMSAIAMSRRFRRFGDAGRGSRLRHFGRKSHPASQKRPGNRHRIPTLNPYHTTLQKPPRDPDPGLPVTRRSGRQATRTVTACSNRCLRRSLTPPDQDATSHDNQG